MKARVSASVPLIGSGGSDLSNIARIVADGTIAIRNKGGTVSHWDIGRRERGYSPGRGGVGRRKNMSF